MTVSNRMLKTQKLFTNSTVHKCTIIAMTLCSYIPIAETILDRSTERSWIFPMRFCFVPTIAEVLLETRNNKLINSGRNNL